MSSERLQKERRAAGLCPRCGRQAFGRSLCCICLKKHAVYIRHRHIMLIHRGFCRSCGRPREQNDKTLCNRCLRKAVKYDRKKVSKNRLAGRCALCGRVSKAYRCLGCRRKVNIATKQKYWRHVHDHICPSGGCGRAVPIGQVYCAEHKALLSSRNKMIRTRRKQEMKCCVCGGNLGTLRRLHFRTLCDRCADKRYSADLKRRVQNA